MSGSERLRPARLRADDLGRVASIGLRTRRLRAGLSALGIAIGVAAIVAVLGLSASSRAGLLKEIDRLGTNLLTAENGQSFTGTVARLPLTASRMIGGIEGVEAVAETGLVEEAKVYRTPLVPSIQTNGLKVQAASVGLPGMTSTGVAQGAFLNAATAREPVAVLGATAAQRLGIEHLHRGLRIWLGGQWFYVAGVLEPSVLAPQVDTSVLVGFAAAKRYLGYASVHDGHELRGPATTIYLRAETSRVEAVQSVLAQTANPEAPNEVDVSQPSDALTARAAAQGALDSLFLGLGAVALLVGAVGVANIMVISVLERRSEIGLRRALGATRAQIRAQFLSEAVLLGMLGGLVGTVAGVAATAVYASGRSWIVVVPTEAWAGGIAAAIVIGAGAGLMPAIRAARMSPTEALRSA